MFCVKCGMRITEDSKFCSYCGAQVPVREKAPENPPVSEEKTVETVTAMEEKPVEAPETAVAAEEKPAEAVEAAVVTEEKPIETAEAAVVTEEKPADTAETSVKTEEKNAEPASGVDFSYSAPVTPIKKKSRKGLAIGITAGVLAVGAVLGFYCFGNEISRLIMGDVEFARKIERSTLDYMNRSPVTEEALSEAIAGAVEGALTENKTVYNDDLDEILETYGDSEVTMSLDLDLDFLGAMAFGSELNRYLDSHSLVRVMQGEDFNKISYVFIEKDEEIIGADLYTTDDRTVLTLPGLTEQVFLADNVSEDGKTAEPFDPKEAQRIADKLSEIYFRAFDMAQITFTNGEFDLGGTEPVKCQEVRVYFTPELFRATLNEIVDYLEKDEYLKNYYINSGKGTEAEYTELFAAMKKGGGDFTCINYITRQGLLCGKKYIIGADTEEGRKVASGSFSLNESGADMSLSVEGEYSAEISDVKNEDGKSGLVTVKVLTEDMDEKPAVFEIEYSGIDKVNYNGITVPTGKYTLRMSADSTDIIEAVEKAEAEENAEEIDDQGYDTTAHGVLTEFFEDSYISWGTECDGESVDSFFTLRIDTLGEVTLDTHIVPYEGEKPVMPDTSGAIDLDSDFDDPEYIELKKEIYENLLALGERSELIKAIGEYMDIEDKLSELEDDLTYGVNYKNYSESTRMYADYVAETLADNFDTLYADTVNAKGFSTLDDPEYVKFLIKKLDPEGVKIKLYFDENGELQVIDDGGCYFIDFTQLTADDYDLESMYVEIIMGPLCVARKDSGDCFVTVVYTDDPENLPSRLPDVYNFYDRAFEWNSNIENINENFIMGSNGTLAEKISASRSVFRILFEDAETYNGYAEKLSFAAAEFFSGKEKDYFKYPYGGYSVEVEKTDGEWKIVKAYDDAGFTKTFEDLFDGKSEEFLAYLDKSGYLTDVTGVSAEIIMDSDYEGVHYVLGTNAVPLGSELRYDTVDELPSAADYRTGYFRRWSTGTVYPNIAGIYYDMSTPMALGTYCLLSGQPLGDMRYMYELRLSELIKVIEIREHADETAAYILERYEAEDTPQLLDHISENYDEEYFDIFDTLPLTPDIPSAVEGGAVIKLYFNENGVPSFIDEAGHGFYDFSVISQSSDPAAEYLKNAYVEIFVCGSYGDAIGANVVYTDNPDKLPENLPTLYNYMDNLYEWGVTDKENTKDGFIVGTSCALAEGVSTARRNLERIDRYNQIAEDLGKATVNFFELKPDDYFEEDFVKNGPTASVLLLLTTVNGGKPKPPMLMANGLLRILFLPNPSPYTGVVFQNISTAAVN